MGGVLPLQSFSLPGVVSCSLCGIESGGIRRIEFATGFSWVISSSRFFVVAPCKTSHEEAKNSRQDSWNMDHPYLEFSSGVAPHLITSS